MLSSTNVTLRTLLTMALNVMNSMCDTLSSGQHYQQGWLVQFGLNVQKTLSPAI
jgi:hypothetical protein